VEPEVLTADEVARLLRLSAKTVRMKAGKGEIPAKKVGKVWRFVRSDLEAYLRHSEPEPTAPGRAVR
jgi:PTS system nitrogen regulatory IIA component